MHKVCIDTFSLFPTFDYMKWNASEINKTFLQMSLSSSNKFESCIESDDQEAVQSSPTILIGFAI